MSVALRWGTAWIISLVLIFLAAPDPRLLFTTVTVLAFLGGLTDWGNRFGSSWWQYLFWSLLFALSAVSLLFVMIFPREIWVVWLSDVTRGQGKTTLGAGVAFLVSQVLFLLVIWSRGKPIRFFLTLGVLAGILGLLVAPGILSLLGTALTLLVWSAVEALSGLKFRKFLGASGRWLVLWGLFLILATLPVLLFQPNFESFRNWNPLPDYRKFFANWMPDLELPAFWPGTGSTSGARRLGEPPHLSREVLFDVHGKPNENVYLVQSVFTDFYGSFWLPKERKGDRKLIPPTILASDLIVWIRQDYLLSGPFPESYAVGVRTSQASERGAPIFHSDLPWQLIPAARRGESFTFQSDANWGVVDPPESKDSEIPEYLKALLASWVQKYRSLSREAKLEALRTELDKACRYTIKPDAQTKGKDFVTEFLTDSKKGFCEHFASAAVFLARASGIPSRYATGWRGRTDFRGNLKLDGYSAHAWAEVWDPAGRWVVWETTPPESIQTLPPFDIPASSMGNTSENLLPDLGKTGVTSKAEGAPWVLGLTALLGLVTLGSAIAVFFWRIRFRGPRGFSRWLSRWTDRSRLEGPQEGGWGAWGKRIDVAYPELRYKAQRWALLWEGRLWSGKNWTKRDEFFHRLMLRRCMSLYRSKRVSRN